MMTPNRAREVLIISSLSATAVQMIFLFIGPSVGFPLDYTKSIQLLQIVSPVFLGYLGSATHFVFMTPPPQVQANNQFLGPLVIGPIAIYAVAIVALFSAFWYSNRPGAPIPGGMSPDNLSTSLTIALGLLAATTSIIVSFLFVSNRPEPSEPTPRYAA
jgi:hypothetical protein